MSTYTSMNHETYIDWMEVIDKLNKGELTDDDIIYYSDKSNSWVTCACGNLCKSIPRWNNGEPRDDRLSKLGHKFSVTWLYIRNNEKCQKSKANLTIILEQIEQRSIKLLREIS